MISKFASSTKAVAVKILLTAGYSVPRQGKYIEISTNIL